ncbi:hypothetical protein [Sagittula stellata]
MYRAAERYFIDLLHRGPERHWPPSRIAADLREANRYERAEHDARWDAPTFWRI